MGAGASALDPNQSEDGEGKGLERDGGDGTYDPLQAQAAAHWRRVLLHAREQIEERKRAEEDGVAHALADNDIVEEVNVERETRRINDVVRVNATPSRLVNSNEDPSPTSMINSRSTPTIHNTLPARATTAPIEPTSSSTSTSTIAPRGPPPVRYIGRPVVNGQPIQPLPPQRPSPSNPLVGGGGGDSIHNASFCRLKSSSSSGGWDE